MHIINKPIRDLFFSLVSDAEKSIKISSPYIKHSIADEIYQIKRANVHVSVVTKVNLMDIYKSASDISALKLIHERSGDVYNFPRLLAKFYIFDDRVAIISSANLTPSGFTRNYEYGVFLDELPLVRQTCEDFHRLCSNESTGRLKTGHFEQIENIINTLPKPQQIEIPKLELDYSEPVESIFDRGSEYIRRSLTGWKKAVFNEIDALGKQVFTTSDFIHMIPALKEQYRNNRNIEAKIRQQLQYLRDLGLVKFEGNGVYKKLWE